jgi:hypothetical protein
VADSAILAICGALVGILGLFLSIMAKANKQGREQGEQSVHIEMLLKEVQALRDENKAVTALVLRLVAIEEQRH